MASSNPFFQAPDYSGIFPVVGTDFKTGKRDIDLAAPFKPGFDVDLTQTVLDSKTTPYESKTKDEVDKSSTGDVYDYLRALGQYQQEMYPLELQRMRDAYGLQSELSQQQLETAIPMLADVQRQSILANLGASKEFKKFKAQRPSNVQAIMASKQNQMAQAQAGEAALQQATATQQNAATEFARSYIPRMVSFNV
jgi:hypothetical protein